MKKILFLFFLSVMSLVSKAQTELEPQLKVSYELGVDEDKNQSYGGELVVGYRMSDDFRLGAGAGIYWCKHLYEKSHYNSLINYYSKEYKETASYIPLFVNGKYNFVATGELRPYLSVDLGYSIFNSASSYADDNEMGVFVKPAFGVDYSIGEGALFFEVGYKYQDRKFQEVKMGYSQLTISVGYQF